MRWPLLEWTLSASYPQFYAGRTILGLKTMHNAGILYRDLKVMRRTARGLRLS